MSTIHAPDIVSTAGRRELVLAATLLVGFSTLLEAADTPVLAVLLPVAVLLAGLGALAAAGAPSKPIAALLLAAVLTGGVVAGLHLVPPGIWLLVVLGAFAVALDRELALETRIVLQPSGASESDRWQVLVAAVATAFVAFTGVAALVPGGMPEPAASATAGTSSMSQGWLAVLAVADALVAMAVAWRLSALRFSAPLQIARSALTYALVTAVAAGLIRAIDLPRLVGPAVLTLVFYLWDAQHASAPARRRERRFLFEMLLLAALAIVVVAWNARVPG